MSQINFLRRSFRNSTCISFLLTAFAVLPVLAVAAVQKGYILPVCLTLVYTFLGFILLMVNMYLHPLSSMTAIVMQPLQNRQSTGFWSGGVSSAPPKAKVSFQMHLTFSFSKQPRPALQKLRSTHLCKGTPPEYCALFPWMK